MVTRTAATPGPAARRRWSARLRQTAIEVTSYSQAGRETRDSHGLRRVLSKCDPSDHTLRVKYGAPLVGRNSRPSQFRLDRPLRADRSAIPEGGFQPVSLTGPKRRLICSTEHPVDERLAEVVPLSMGREIRPGGLPPGPHRVVSFETAVRPAWQPSKPRPRVTVAGLQR